MAAKVANEEFHLTAHHCIRPVPARLDSSVAIVPTGRSMARMPKAIIFDFDGVIVDTEPLHFEAFCDVLPGFGITLSRDSYFSSYVGMSDKEILRRVLLDQGRRLTSEQVQQLLHDKDIAYRRRIEPGLDLVEGVETLIRGASLRWGLAICSGSKRVEIEHILHRADLLSLFPVIVATEDVAASKPDPAGYLLTIARLQEQSPELGPDDCLVIEDSTAGVTAAKRAGMRTLQICQGESCAADSPADATVDNLAELADVGLEKLLA